ncbi:hypothetical protein MKW94_006186 [Papaver nudicaule]|uniref:Bms1-type G domain-containing protein n=1 Tax=Papaver nudicaule TaxID=74823 RepID=A0AA41RWK4_PAPNU|nr:hypothetical protein [Papaver nudicaule]
MTPSSSSSSSRKGDSNIEYGLSYLKIYNKTYDQNWKDPDPTCMDTASEVQEPPPPPYVIVVQGPPKVGKTLLIKSLVDFYTKGSSPFEGPVRIMTGGDKGRRVQFVECPNNMNGMIDAAKYADAVILLVDAGYGFEMETFEFLELLKVHGMPKVMGVLTYLDTFKNAGVLANTKPRLMHQFQTEICKGAQVFCLSGLDNDAMYLEHEIFKLASYISSMEFHPLSWRAAHPYMLVDHFIDITPRETIEKEKECPRDIILKGYLRGCHIEEGTKVHIAGVGDFLLARVTSLADPFPVLPVDSDLAELSCMENGYCRAGTYVSFQFHNVPFEMVKNHNPCQPILVGGITIEEESVGQIQVKLQRHSWHLKLLKSKAPIIVSVGWRRYETRPIYALKGRRGSYCFLRRTPQNMPCSAIFWGPLAPPSTGLAVVQSLADNKAAFRFLAKAFVVGANKAARIVKKSMRIGTPVKIFKNTAFIKDMFTSDLEIANFKDAKIETASGIYGKINEPAGEDLISGLESKDGQPREGIAKCTFKRKIRKHDTIFMHVYEKVEVPRIFHPIMRRPEPPDRIWDGVVDIRGADRLSADADFESYHKTHIDPLEPEDRSMWVRAMCLRRQATSKKEKQLVKHQLEELGVAADKRMKELTSTLRRQTVEQLRAKQKKTEKQSVLISEDHQEDEDLMKGFEEAWKRM